MPLDAVCLMALRGELEQALSGARVDKVYMPAREEVHLSLRTAGGHRRLLLSAGGNQPRVHLTEAARENPAAPPMFCMLLRKHLTGARLAAIEQPALERALSFRFDATDELGEPCRKTLVCELIGRHSNLILCDPDERVIDCVKRVDAEMSERRQVLPGLFYRQPPTQEKQNPLDTGEDVWRALLASASPDTDWDSWLLARFNGLSPLVCRELAARARDGGPEALWASVSDWRARVRAGQFEPWLLLDGENPVDFSYLPITQYGGQYTCLRADSFSHMLDTCYAERSRREQLKARAQDMTRLLATLRDRARRKLTLQQTELEQTKDRERLREYGDILMANLHAVPRGVASVTLEDFYRGGQVAVALNPALSPQQNAARYYKDCQRAKTAQQTLRVQLEKGETELAYLESVLEALARAADPRDVQEIRQELAQEGYLREPKGKRPAKPTPSVPLRFVSSTGQPFLAGRNNRQNDQLTLKQAARGDLWLHTQKIPGAHVLIPGGAPDETTLLEAARVAATLSQAAKSPKVPVDYTRVAHVKKPPGAKPGMVIYDNFKTLLVEPDSKLLERLRAE
ncbi:MAG: NFACT family protein [Oscillospiraceae bacterium]|jgi:predicted ribosome quality control (RQC) complex YloA/Tae2 family protein|nr:NFACT family protein [Oscillospiraceae bacterium]